MKLSGLFIPLITPFQNDRLDEKGFRSLLHFLTSHKPKGFFLLGSTAEALTLSLDEKKQILSIAREECKDFPLYVGIGHPSITETIANLHFAQDYGATGALLVTPYYMKPTQEGLLRYFEAISKSSSFPLVLYNNPSRTNVDIDSLTLSKLAEIPTIVGLKESISDLQAFGEKIAAIKFRRPDFAFLCGDDPLIYPMMLLGAQGAISAASNLVPDRIKDLVTACLHRDFVQAERNHFSLLPLFKALSIETNPIPLKYAMQKRGLPAGDPRLPLTPLSVQHRLHVDRIVETLPALLNV